MGVLAAILWLTKPNFFNKNKEAPIVEEIVETPVPEIIEEEIIEPEEDLISAKEDFIVITPEPVVPEIPEPKEEAVPEDIIYRIKWGDTLWDLADSYYQNPWLYKKIAKANNIKNPDVIISGTDIVIPPLN
jgi:nucleoid-associated protein YgaU